MPRKPTGKPAGRPILELDWEEFENLCRLQCTQSEIASFMKIHTDTLRDRAVKHYGLDYSDIYKKYSECGKCSLRRNQFVLSKKNATMAIWLGKQWLGQVDTPHEVNVNPETLKQFNLLMSQLSSLQSARKTPDINLRNDAKSL